MAFIFLLYCSSAVKTKAGEAHIRFYFSELFFLRSPIVPSRILALQINSNEKTGYDLLAA